MQTTEPQGEEEALCPECILVFLEYRFTSTTISSWRRLFADLTFGAIQLRYRIISGDKVNGEGRRKTPVINPSCRCRRMDIDFSHL